MHRVDPICRREVVAAAQSCPLACMPAHPALDIEEFSDFVPQPGPSRSGPSRSPRRVGRRCGAMCLVHPLVLKTLVKRCVIAQ